MAVPSGSDSALLVSQKNRIFPFLLSEKLSALKEVMGDYEKEQIKKDMAVQEAVTLVAESAKVVEKKEEAAENHRSGLGGINALLTLLTIFYQTEMKNAKDFHRRAGLFLPVFHCRGPLDKNVMRHPQIRTSCYETARHQRYY